jgi:hypothetical protein
LETITHINLLRKEKKRNIADSGKGKEKQGPIESTGGAATPYSLRKLIINAAQS